MIVWLMLRSHISYNNGDSTLNALSAQWEWLHYLNFHSIQEIPTTSVEQHTTEQAALQHAIELAYTDECKDEHLRAISQQMEKWKLVAALLDLTPAEIEVIEHDNQRMQMMRYNTLIKWKSKALLSGTATCTYQVLLQALEDCGCNDACSQLKKCLKLWLCVCLCVCLLLIFLVSPCSYI